MLGAALSALEDLELPLLSWGYVDAALSEQEVLQALQAVAQQDRHADVDAEELDAENLLHELAEQALVLQVAPGRWRSRLAEGLRLAVNLRQLLGAGEGQWWLAGRRLVADFRVHAATRRYPRRDCPRSDVEQSLSDLGALGQGARAVLAAYLPADQFLARFQVQATSAIHAALAAETTKAVIVAAGTGSGKTRAFYLPAFTWMAERLQARTSPTSTSPHRSGRSSKVSASTVQALAIYPRTELLKDQVSEALDSVLAINAQLRQRGMRPLRVGALYGDTPGNAAQVGTAAWLQESWRPVGQGRRCPYAACPHCSGDLIWRDADRTATPAREVLTCAGCNRSIDGDVLPLTRAALSAAAPDLLFTTTEMLNRSSADPWLGKLFGFAPRGSRPRLLLLDEVHTYEGVHGAHVALLLRRWRHAVGSAVTVVGLSATLRQAEAFMAQLVGVPEADVTLIEPAEEDMVEEGRQYQVALRGDPTSGVSLLSTTIQTAMLFGRLLDPSERRGPGPHAPSLYGSKGFLFTDDLDVTNRLFHDLRDAEGEGWMARRRSGAFKVLANLRSTRLLAATRRDADGQVWALPERIGHPLPGTSPARALKISKTSSQDPGVAAAADLVVATASLDVGFNDPRVGLVLQHKSPREAAQFLQRRGRAGRTREVRPLTAVVLSDFGRDRLTYQAYDRLFEPELSPRTLPVANRYIQRMQATWVLKDWLARRLQLRTDAGRLLTAASTEDASTYQRVGDLLQALLEDAATQEDLAQFLRWALRVDAEDAQALLWDPPRALLTAVVPTLLRRVRTRWQPVGTDPVGAARAFAVEFVPAALFAELNLPDVRLELPPGHGENVEPALPILQALTESAPGRVSKRFAVRSGAHTTWVPIPLGQEQVDLALSDFVTDGSVLGTWTDDASGQSRLVVRPHTIRLARPPREVAESSNARPRWFTQILTTDDGHDDGRIGLGTEIGTESHTGARPEAGSTSAAAPVPSPWSRHVRSITFHTHAARRPLEVRRFSPGSTARLRSTRAGASTSTAVSYRARSGESAALGFALDVDGIRVQVALPAVHELLTSPWLRTPGWRSTRFRHLVASDETLRPWADDFTRPWLALAVEYAVLASATGAGGSGDEVVDVAGVLVSLDEQALRAASARLSTGEHPGGTAGGAASEAGEEAEATNADGAPADPRQLRARLEGALAVAEVRQTLLRHARVLHATPDTDDARFAQHVFAHTVGAAVKRTCLTLAGNAADNDLLLDVITCTAEQVPGSGGGAARAAGSGDRPDQHQGQRAERGGSRPPGPDGEAVATIWLTESTVGGAGIIEALAREYARDPRRFWRLSASALEMGEYETVDQELTRLLQQVNEHPQGDLARDLHAVRGARSAAHTRQALAQLHRHLRADGYATTHPVLAAISIRLLRPGTTARFDAALLQVLQYWRTCTERLGIEVDARTWAALALQVLPEVRDVFASPDQLYSTLWPRGSDVFHRDLHSYAPYSDAVLPLHRHLSAAFLGDVVQQVSVHESNWRAAVDELLLQHGVVDITARPDAASTLKSALLDISATPLDAGYLLLHPVLRRIRRDADGLRLRVELKESEQ
ncbi:protein DpdJ [Kineococcus sp. SYSU DK005]|uniref:protein DpdJ n=1 Tax=Kineococcus sp. SYSU DK005 TaxID=3383126 RepID=UPI003D7D9103